ncbi:helix-turn-helix transcriptional regulator [Evansella sp. AB-P1]|uniref:helix-turn-helix domain-containing protein n=1 Tax=Evansella sp. AB-P1 TaxID=3037653 RepID=UPI00241EC27F|nr:helix-turn-helix transcriptional regulator [Evansella sp. AB-P1]MDG5789317.1 helix-turn-helix transcriptional regulator [Evansella sp. AB-P1]
MAERRYELTEFIGPAIKYMRKELGYTQEELSTHSGKDDKFIGRIERGVNKNVTLSTLTEISYGLKISPSKLLLIAEELENNSLDRTKE